MPEHESPCRELIAERGRIDSLEHRIGKQDEVNKEFFVLIHEIRDKLLNRPSWPVTTIVTVLSSVCVGLIIKLISK